MKGKIEKLGKVSITVEKDYWDKNKAYNRLTIVERQGTRTAYLSRKAVPIGIDITDRNYWITISKWADIPYEIVQEFGDSPELVISQKVVTLKVNELQGLIDNINEIIGEGGSIDERIAVETSRAQVAEELLREAYESLSQTQVIPKTAEEWTSMTSWEEGVIYRVAGTTSYTDYMYNGTTTVPMATYNNAIDDEPTAGSNNLVKSGGIHREFSKLSIKHYVDGSLNVTDEGGNVIAKFDGQGLKTKKYNVCDEDGNIIFTIDENHRPVDSGLEIGNVSPNYMLYISDENKNAILGIEKALLSSSSGLFIAGEGGLKRIADAFPAIHLDYSAENEICEIYVRIGKTDKYVKFNYCHDINTSDEIYKDIWRIGRSNPTSIHGAVLCQFDGIVFNSLGKIILSSLENEFTMEFAGKADHTGGVHGDERIDVEQSCGVDFIADGVILGKSSDFHLDCNDFRVVQKSTLHETADAGGSYIAGHPVIAWHTKTTVFGDCGYECYNFIKIDIHNQEQNVQTKSIYSGLICVGKDVATKVYDESGFLFDATGNGYTFLGTSVNRNNHGKKPNVFMLNTTNGISCCISSGEYGNIEGVLVDGAKSEFTSFADRTSDTKYYCYEPNRLLSTGDRISLNSKIKFLIK